MYLELSSLLLKLFFKPDNKQNDAIDSQDTGYHKFKGKR
tara:strand:- start:536 stop:652 length:117 start_codon:yes stop_codon:yes gene_type:complete